MTATRVAALGLPLLSLCMILSCGAERNEIIDLDVPALSPGCKLLMNEVFGRCGNGESGDEDFIGCPPPSDEGILGCSELCGEGSCRNLSGPENFGETFALADPRVNLRIDGQFPADAPDAVLFQNWGALTKFRSSEGIRWFAFSLGTADSRSCYSVIAGVSVREWRYLLTFVCPRDMLETEAALGDVGPQPEGENHDYK